MIEGIASVDESAITGESAPVIREAGGDRSAVTGGTRVLSDRIVVEITQEPGKSFLDRMIALVEGAERRKTPNEIALNILLAGLTLVFLVAVVTLRPFAEFSGTDASVATLIALLVALIPTTIGALLSAIGIAGMDRLVRRNVLASRVGPSRHPATWTCCCSTRPGRSPSATARRPVHPMPGLTEKELAEAAQLASLADETPEGRSIVVLAKSFGIREREMPRTRPTFVPFTAETRMSGVDVNGRRLRKGATDAIVAWVEAEGGRRPPSCRASRTVSARGRDAAGGGPGRQGPRRRLSQGRDQGGDARALRPAPSDGHPHGDGHRRQPASPRPRSPRSPGRRIPRRRRRRRRSWT